MSGGCPDQPARGQRCANGRARRTIRGAAGWLPAKAAPREGRTQILDAQTLLPIRLTINGEVREAAVPARRTLTDLLRYDLGLTGTKEACSVGVCGACTVMLDGRHVASCIILAVQADGRAVTTIEGVAAAGQLHPLQQAFIDHGGFQCGICTPGQIIAAKALLDSNPRPTEHEIKAWMMGNLCRCTGYYQIIEAIVRAGERGSGGWGARNGERETGNK